MKNGVRNLLITALTLIIAGGLGYWIWSQSRNQVSAESVGIFSTTETTFGCNPPQYEAGCKLVAWDNSRAIRAEFGFIEYSQGAESVLPSPDGKSLLLVREHELTLVDITSLKQKVLAQAPQGQAYGIYSGFPSFIPQVTWLTNKQIRASLFKDGTLEPGDGEPPATPLVIRVISIE